MQIDTAMAKWRRLLGGNRVHDERARLLSCQQATFATKTRVLGLVQPASMGEVGDILRIANKFSIPIYASSRGRNCGYGSTVPYRDSVLMDLQNMNRISEYDEELACVRIQPGVTQTQLAEFLRERGSKLWMDPIATFEDCSVLANILERGHGMTGNADRIASGTDYEIVLPNGDTIRTGFGGYSGARTAALDRWAPGPSMEGLFSQSNLGVVTEMTVWLMPKPDRARLLVLSLDSNRAMELALDRLRKLRLERTIQFGPRLFNDMRLLQTFSRYPWQKMSGKVPLDEKCAREICAEMDIPLWTCAIGFYGNEKQIAADFACVMEGLGDVARTHLIIDDVDPGQPPHEGRVVERFARSLYKGMTGQVSPVTERPRWRQKRQAQNNDWSKDGCGIIWFPVSAPFRGRDVSEAIEVIRATVASFGFEPDMSVSSIRERTLELNCSIVFDREDSTQEQNAIPCVRETLARLAKLGFYPHRLGIPTMEAYGALGESNRKLLAQFKALVDPQGLLSVGRY